MRNELRNVWAVKSAAASGQCESISMYSAKAGICPLSLHARKGSSSGGRMRMTNAYMPWPFLTDPSVPMIIAPEQSVTASTSLGTQYCM